MKSRLFKLAAALVLASYAAWAASQEEIGDVFVHDPSMIKEDEQRWVFSTGLGIQTFLQDKKTRIWRRASPVFKEEPSWWASAVPQHTRMDVWAPDLQTYNGRIWLYYSISSFGSNISAIGLASTDKISSGTWVDEGLVLKSSAEDDFNAIDPDLVLDADKQPWLTFGSFWSGLKLIRLDPHSMRPVGERISIAARPAGIEAPSIVFHAGYYYLFASIDKCCQGSNSTYKLIYGRAKEITGPYLDKDGKPLLEGGGSILDQSGKRWRGPGGADIVGDFVVRHAYDDDDLGKSKLRIDRLHWRKGWPSLK